MGLRIKILSGFLILSTMLIIAGLWSIYELSSMGSSVQKILNENYQSIQASKKMIEALEREDSGILLLMLGRWEEGRSTIQLADSLFQANLDFAYQNITIPGEQSHLDTIKEKYSLFKSLWERPIVDTPREGNIDWYSSQIHKSFLQVKSVIDKLIQLNDITMYQTASELENRSKRAIMPGIIAVISALIFTLIFTYLVNYFMIRPIIHVSERIKKFVENRTPFEVEVETHDEISELETSIRTLCQVIETRDSTS
jgi:methyl-accepting chemotaxis protein